MRAREGLLPMRRSAPELGGLARDMESAGRRLDSLDPPRFRDVPRRRALLHLLDLTFPGRPSPS